MKNLNNFIGNNWSKPQSNEWLDDVNPATQEVIAHIPKSNEQDVSLAVDFAKKAWPGWAQTSVEDRAAFLERIADLIQERFDEFCEMESLDTGKPLWLCRELDIPRAISNFRFFAQAVRQTRGQFFETKSSLSYSLRQPIGVVGLITPWNLPLYLLSWKIAPAIAMGNTVVAKPSELTPMTAHLLGEVIIKSELPAGVVNIVHGTGPEVGEAIVNHPDVKAISFTGGTKTGEHVAEMAAPKFKKLSLELGGKNPTLVFADCDFKATVQGVVRSSFLNQGQICLCGSRILIEKSIYVEFVKAMVQEISQWPVGNPQDSKTKIGSLISLAHREKVSTYVQYAREDGGQVLCGGMAPPIKGDFELGAFYMPTLIDKLQPTCRTATEEVFGPVVTVHPFESEEEAVKIANGVRYGLSATVWTTNLQKAHRVASQIDAGTVWINTWLMRDLRVPFGGMKDSGVGREGGEYSLDFFSETKTVCTAK